MLTAEWQAILAAGGRALFAYRVRTEQERRGDEQRDFVEGSGVSQQPLSELERGVRVHITTAMLHVAARVTGLCVPTLEERRPVPQCGGSGALDGRLGEARRPGWLGRPCQKAR